MKKIAFALVSMTMAAACGSPSSNGNPSTGGAFTLSDGTYTYNATSAPVNTCWAPPKTTLTLPLTMTVDITVSGATVTVTTQATASLPSQSFTLTKTDNALSGTNDGVVDLNQGANPIDCKLDIHSTLNATMTANDKFDATIDVQASEDANPGTQCGILIGTISPQVDALPCELKLAGPTAK